MRRLLPQWHLLSDLRGVKNLGLGNLSFSQYLDKAVDVDLASVFDSFYNDLMQLEHLYPPLRISKEWVRLDQVIEYGKVSHLEANSFFFTFLPSILGVYVNVVVPCMPKMCISKGWYILSGE